MILRHKKLEKQICSCFCASLWFRVSHVTPSPHAASGNAFKSSKPGKRAAFMLVEHTVCFGQLPNLLPSLLCVTLCGPSLSLCLTVLSETSKIEKHHFAILVVVWPVDLLLQRVRFTRDQMAEKIFASSVFQSTNRNKDTVAFHSLVPTLHVGGIRNLFHAAGGP